MFFFFQAEDGIRYRDVTGVQTCALPILIKQTQASSTQSLERDLEESGRLALLEIARSVRLAGYGTTPIAAFDFDRYACATPGTGSTCPNGGRDRIDGPGELGLPWRDPSFL